MVLDLKTEFLGLARLLHDEAVPYAVCGGIAVAIHGYPRVTRDIDLLVRERDLKKVREAVGKAGFTLSSGLIPFDTGKKTERRVFRVSKAEDEDILTLDLILAEGFLEEAWSSRERFRIGGQEIEVVSRNGLRKMKTVAGRPQDLADLSELGLGEEK